MCLNSEFGERRTFPLGQEFALLRSVEPMFAGRHDCEPAMISFAESFNSVERNNGIILTAEHFCIAAGKRRGVVPCIQQIIIR